MKDLVVIGGGGLGRDAIDVVHALNADRPTWRIVGVLDDNLSSANASRLASMDIVHLGGVDALDTNTAVALCIGDPVSRVRLYQRLRPRVHSFPSLIHPTSSIGSLFSHDEGLIALAGVTIGTNVSLGKHVHINARAVIGHDTTIADFVSVNPNATISGECSVGRASLVGASSVVLQQLRVGDRARVGASACVTKDVAEDSTVVGIPARAVSTARDGADLPNPDDTCRCH